MSGVIAIVFGIIGEEQEKIYKKTLRWATKPVFPTLKAYLEHIELILRNFVMFIILIVILTVVMLATSLALYRFVEKFANMTLRDVKWYLILLTPVILILILLCKFIDKSILGQMMYNFGVSMIFVIFTGTGLYAGAANLIASLLFPLALYIKRKITVEKY